MQLAFKFPTVKNSNMMDTQADVEAITAPINMKFWNDAWS
jgi:hypothetical protein